MARTAIALAALGAFLGSTIDGLGDGSGWSVGPYTFSDELGGFIIRAVSGTGTRDDPIVIEQEMLSASPVTLTVRVDLASVRVGALGSYGMLFLRLRSRNNSGIAWTEYEFELQTQLGQPSVFGDGLSFDQRRSAPENRSSDLFRINNTDFEPFDRLVFSHGHVDPLDTASFSFFITDFTPRWQFYIRQDPRIPMS